MRVPFLLLALPAAVLAQPQFSPAQRQQQPSNCAADGYVVNALTGEPIPRALIQVLAAVQAGAVADSAGRWKVSGITCGRINVIASKAGFLNTGMGRAVMATSQSVPVATPDSPVHDMRVELVPQSVVTGKVIDEAGDPMQGVQIMVMTSRVLEGRRSFQSNGGSATNDLGDFRIAGLPAGKVIVCAHAQNAMQFVQNEGAVFGEKCYPGPVEGGTASAMTLVAGREARVDFTLSPVPAVKIRGRVTGMPENAGAIVSLQQRSTGRVNQQARQANMSRDGTFEVRGVPPGAWMLAVDYWESGKRLVGRVPVDVGGSDVEGVTVHLESGFSVAGAVRVESQAGHNPNAQQINLNLRGMDPLSATGAVQWDKNHTAFTINDATPGNYLLNVNLPAPFYLKSALLGGRDLSREAVPIMQAAGPIDVVIADDAGILQGRMEDANGEAASGWVMVWRDGRPPSGQPTAPDGAFKIGGLAPGDYRVFGWDDYQQVEWADPDWMRRNGGSGVAVSVTAGQTSETKITRVIVPRD